jgi:hypothetical protein
MATVSDSLTHIVQLKFYMKAAVDAHRVLFEAQGICRDEICAHLYVFWRGSRRSIAMRLRLAEKR